MKSPEDNSSNALALASELLGAESPKKAIRVLQEALRTRRDDWRLHEALGDALITAGREEEAIGSLMTASRLNPESADACVKIGRIYLRRQLTEPALVWLRRAIDIDESNSEALSSAAVAKVQGGRRKEAEGLLEAWIAADPDNPIRPYLATAILGKDAPPAPPREYVSRLFDEYADRFDDALKRLHYNGPQMVADAIKEWDIAPGVVLDAGCGTGLVGQLIHGHADRLVGVDLAEKMVAATASRGVYDELHHGDMVEFMDQRPEGFDLITASDVLTYVGDLAPFLTAASVALKPGGWVIAVLEESCDDQSDADAAGFRLQPNGRYSHREGYLKELLEDRGFDLRQVLRKPMRYEHGKPAPSFLFAALKSAT